jgi:hypothetical protein
MREFRDDQGRPWIVALTVASAERVRGLVTVDVTDDVEQPDGSTKRQTRSVPFDMIDASNIAQTLEVLRSNYGRVGEVLYALCRKQADDKSIDRESFLDGLRGDAIDAGIKAIEGELTDFFPLRLRRMIALLVDRTNELAGELMSQAEENLKKVTVKGVLSGNSSGSVPESSASIQANGPSDNSSSLATPA